MPSAVVGTFPRRGRLALAFVVLIAISFVGVVSAPDLAAVAGAAGPEMTVSPSSAVVNQTVMVTATGLPPGSIYQVQICGQNAVQGSPDCAGVGSSTTQADSRGVLSTPLQVVFPPTQCPCVVAAFPTTIASPLTTAISIQGASTSAPIAAPQTPVSHLVVVHAAFVGSTPFKQWFGFQATRTLAVTLHNTGTAPASQLHLFASLGSTPVVSQRLGGALAPGQIFTYNVPVTFPAFSVGNQSLNGHIVTGDGQNVSFKASVSIWPFGLVVVALIIAQMILLAWRNVVRRRYERNNPPGAEADELSEKHVTAEVPVIQA